jgi:hypothetical protein
MSKFLFDVQQKNRLKQKGLLKRFSIICYGHQESVEEMRAEKAKKFKELKDKRGTHEYEEWFLNYRPEKGKKDEYKNDKKEVEVEVEEGKKGYYTKKFKTKKYKGKRRPNGKGFFNIFSMSKSKKRKN